VGSDGETWFRDHDVAGNARSSWWDPCCCPTALARAFAEVPNLVAEVGDDGHLRINLPLACHIEGNGWDVEVRSGYPWNGDIQVVTNRAPRGGRVAVRVPGWADGRGHRDITAAPHLELPIRPEWWEADPRVAAGRGSAYLRRGPIVYCVEAPADAVDLHTVCVVPGQPIEERDAPILAGGMRVLGLRGRVLPTDGGLYHRLGDGGPAHGDVELTAVPYAARGNRGMEQMTVFLHR
jgi:DUF1680 family protein